MFFFFFLVLLFFVFSGCACSSHCFHYVQRAFQSISFCVFLVGGGQQHRVSRHFDRHAASRRFGWKRAIGRVKERGTATQRNASHQQESERIGRRNRCSRQRRKLRSLSKQQAHVFASKQLGRSKFKGEWGIIAWEERN